MTSCAVYFYIHIDTFMVAQIVLTNNSYLFGNVFSMNQLIHNKIKNSYNCLTCKLIIFTHYVCSTQFIKPYKIKC
jgi:hypothetical protein